MTDEESKRNALRGASADADGGGIRVKIASRTLSTPLPVFAEIWMTSLGSIPKVDCICAAITSGCEAGRSICVRVNNCKHCTLEWANLIQNRYDIQTTFSRNVINGYRLCLYSLSCIYKQQSTLTSRKRPRDFPSKIHVTLVEMVKNILCQRCLRNEPEYQSDLRGTSFPGTYESC